MEGHEPAAKAVVRKKCNDEYGYGECETFKHGLPDGWSVAWDAGDSDDIVLRADDGSYRAAIFVDTAVFHERWGMFPKLEDNFILYIVDNTVLGSLDDAKAHIAEWEAERNERMKKLVEKLNEDVRKNIEDLKRRARRSFWLNI